MRKIAPWRCYDGAFINSPMWIDGNLDGRNVARSTLSKGGYSTHGDRGPQYFYYDYRAGHGQSYVAPLATVTTLFFMWGFLTCLNDILVPHLKSIFDLNYAKIMLIQFAFFGAYFIFSLPSAKIG